MSRNSKRIRLNCILIFRLLWKFITVKRILSYLLLSGFSELQVSRGRCNAAWSATIVSFFPPSPPPALILPVPWISLASLLFPLSNQRGSSHSKPWFCTKLNNRNIKSSFSFLFFLTTGASAYLVRVVPCWLVESLQTVAMSIPISLCISYLTFVLCFMLYLNVLNVSHGMDSLAMGMLHDPFTFHDVFFCCPCCLY